MQKAYAEKFPDSNLVDGMIDVLKAGGNVQQGDADKAVKIFEELREMASTTSTDEPEAELGALLALSLMNADPPEFGRAYDIMIDTLDDSLLRLEKLTKQASGRSLEEAGRDVERHFHALLTLLSTQPADPKRDRACLARLVRFRNLFNLRARYLERLHHRAKAKSNTRFGELLDMIQSLRAAYVATESSSVPGARELGHRIWEKLEIAEAYAARFVDDSALPPPESLDELLERLPENSAVIITTSYLHLLGNKRYPAGPAYTVFLTQKDSIKRIDFREGAMIRDLCKAFRDELIPEQKEDDRGPAGLITKPPATHSMKHRKLLGSALLAPILKQLPENVQTVYLSPEGVLATIPWGVLPSRDGR
ncbi:MAG: hypothetical protein AAF492_30200, partial [Verrucomicrobiota bacterium]